jgi:hypothetical protein
MDRKAKLATGFVAFIPRFLNCNYLCYKYPMIIIDTPVSLADLKAIAGARFGNLVKAVVDVERKIMALDGELHADEEALLLENGSRQEDLWGINIYPELEGPDRIEFDSVINIRPSQGNRSRGIDDQVLREQVFKVVVGLMK